MFDGVGSFVLPSGSTASVASGLSRLHGIPSLRKIVRKSFLGFLFIRVVHELMLLKIRCKMSTLVFDRAVKRGKGVRPESRGRQGRGYSRQANR